MAKTIIEQNNSMDDYIIITDNKYIRLLRPESIRKISIHLKDMLINIQLDDRTEFDISPEGCDGRILDVLVRNNILKVESNGTNNSESGGKQEDNEQ